VVGRLSVRDSVKGTEGGVLYWGTRKMRILRDMQKLVSLYIEALLGNLQGFICCEF
jgi:hypothetical protein